MSELDLMKMVEDRAGKYLAAFSRASSIPEAWWAALTAGESAGDANASRFEPGVYAHLKAVASGETRAYGSITASRLDQIGAESYHSIALDAAFAARNRAKIAAAEDAELRALSTSWCFTQLMGYHSLDHGTLAAIQDPAQHYGQAAAQLAHFCERYGLDPETDFEAMFRCWNTGRPDGVTYNPYYVRNGIIRLRLWLSLRKPGVEVTNGKAT